MIFGANNIPAVSNTSDQLARYAVDEIFKPAAQECVLLHLADKKVMKGESIAIPAYSFLTQVETEAGEFDAYPEARVDYSTKEVFAIDGGLTLPITRQAMEVAHDAMGLLESSKEALKEHMARDLDKKIAASLRSCLVKGVLASATAITYSVNGTPAAAAGSELNVYLVQKLAADAKARWNMKPKAGNKYALVSSYNAMLAVENDATLRNVIQGRGRQELQSFFVGSIGMIDLYATNHDDAIDTSVGSSVYSEWYLLGQKSHFVAFRRAPAIAFQDDANNKVTEFGKFKYLNYNYAAAFGRYSELVNKDSVTVVHGSST
jgi:hypothetical protein